MPTFQHEDPDQGIVVTVVMEDEEEDPIPTKEKKKSRHPHNWYDAGRMKSDPLTTENES